MEIQYSNNISEVKPYAFAEVDKAVDNLRAQGVEVVDFGVGDPSSPTADFVIDALGDASNQRASSGYPSYIGDKNYRQVAALYMERNFNVHLDAETEIISTIGSKEAIFHFPMGFVNQGDYVICPTPGYPPYQNGTRFAGGIPYFVPLLEENDFLIDYEAIPEEICNKAKVIWINYPNSPTGKLASREWLEGLVQWAHNKDIIIAADEGCYIDIYTKEKPMSILEIAKEGIITFYSLSKRNNMTGYRVGFCAGDERIISGFKKVKTNIDSGTPTFIQDAASVALMDDEHVSTMRDEYSFKLTILTQTLQETGLPVCTSESTFYLWQKAPDGMSGIDLARAFLEAGIVTTPGEWISDEISDGSNPGTGYVRFAVVPSMETFMKGIEKIKQLNFNKVKADLLTA
ncbi:MAG: aminotransferase class I/II-fold pyridoxal phosphate-dependent enzyme [Bacteroidota bacterium]